MDILMVKSPYAQTVHQTHMYTAIYLHIKCNKLVFQVSQIVLILLPFLKSVFFSQNMNIAIFSSIPYPVSVTPAICLCNYCLFLTM